MMQQDQNTISQRTIAGGALFRFENDHLHYFGMEWDFKSKYEHLAPKVQYRRMQGKGRITELVFLYFIFLAFVVLLRDQGPHYGAEGAWWLLKTVGPLAGIACIVGAATFYITKTGYTVIGSPNGNILVKRGKHHDRIIEKLQACRLQSLRRLAEPNLANSPEEEEAKLKWLYDEGAITQGEYSQASLHANA